MIGRPHVRYGSFAMLLGVTLLATSCSSGAASPSAGEVKVAATDVATGAAAFGAESSTPAGAGATGAGSLGVAAMDETLGRVAVSVEGGVAVLDPITLELIQEFDTEEFTRLNAAGDGRHVFVSTSAGFQLLDTVTPELTEIVFPATTPGHVVRHAGTTVLFDDGTGTTTFVEGSALKQVEEALPETTSFTADAPHHGVSIALEDGTLLTTLGDENSRTGALALEFDNGEWVEAARNTECPSIHGEGTAADEAVIFGCADGALLFHDGTFEKFTAPDEYGRMGNAYVSETSPIVVGDYKNDPDAEGYLLNAVTLIDTAEHTYEVVTLPEDVQYTFRDVARGPEDLAYILSTDGSVHVLDPETGDIIRDFPLIDPWEGPADWQDAHPAIVANGDIAYVTEPATRSVHAVNLITGEITATVTLDGVPNEIAVTLPAL